MVIIRSPERDDSKIARRFTPRPRDTIEYVDDSGRKALLTLRFEGVALAILPAIRPNAYLSELEIADVRQSQLEGIRYIAKTFHDDVFEIHCSTIEITDCIPLG